ncbi:MATE family efflux transporter [Photobacterium sp. DNB23_23_1]|uniref:MATE family efflux transporter n=1 Tax=Photobacterium pectinilyticum TaxID=2906793 RepID=A0ABT1N903_9GAMM|nr:MATE family efflux transporter [Photobacterium sp. ZSDE20]MDD1829649.1 MATE family efflux transporter [Photobacterium sp. ZSDE20]
MQSMLMIDTLLVSPLGEVPLAAMGISTTILAFILAIQMALANGSQLVLSRAVGSGSQQALSTASWSGMIINCLVASLFWTLLTVFDQPLIQALTDSTPLQQEIADYLMISKYLVLYTGITQVMIALFNSLGKSRITLKGYLLELPINTLLTYLFINGFDLSDSLSYEGMGVQGAALGSIFAITARLIFFGITLYKKRYISFITLREVTSMGRNIRLHFLEIFPVAANVTILMLGATVYQLLYSQLDINAYVAITLVAPWIRSGTQFIAAWSQSSAITISQAIGSKKVDNLSKNVNTSIDVAIGISVLCALLFIGMSFVIADIYPDLDQSTYQALAVIAPLYIILPIVRGYNTVHGNVLRALGKTTAVFKINFTGQWIISIPLCAVIVFGFDNSVFWAFAVQPFEELIRAFPLRHLAKKSLNDFDLQKAEKLMYS